MARPCPICGGDGLLSTGGEVETRCAACNGNGWISDEVLTEPPGGGIGLFLMIALALAGLMALLLSIEVWMRADGMLRPILEAFPGNAVAETADDRGNPILIGALAAAVVIGVGFALSRWRRELIRDYLRGETSYSVLLGASAARMLAIVAGLALIPVVAAIADGADLRAGDPEGTLFDAAWRVIVAGAGLLVFTYLGLRRTIGSVSAKPLPAGDPIPAESYRR